MKKSANSALAEKTDYINIEDLADQVKCYQEWKKHTFKLDPKYCYEFKRIFESSECFLSFYCAITKTIAASISSLKFRDKELAPSYRESKLSIVDVYAKFQDDTECVIDIQLIPKNISTKRTLFHTIAVMHIHDAFQKGENYSPVRKAVTIYLLDFSLFPELQKSVHCFQVTSKEILREAIKEECSERRRTLVSYAGCLEEDFQIYFVELKKNSWEHESAERKKWLMFMNDPYHLESFLKSDPGIRKAYEILESIHDDPELRYAALCARMDQQDRTKEIEFATRAAKEELARSQEDVARVHAKIQQVETKVAELTKYVLDRNDQQIRIMHSEGLSWSLISKICDCNEDYVGNLLQEKSP